MDKLNAWLAAMPVDDVRERVGQLERELARLRLLLADAPKLPPAKATAPVPRPTAAPGKKRARRLSPERMAITLIVREHPDGVAPADVARRIGKHGGTVQAAMWRMANDGQLVNADGRYKLPPTTPTDAPVSGSEAEAMSP